jgi:hypothetical protein
MPKPFIHVESDTEPLETEEFQGELVTEPLELDLIIRISVTDPGQLAHITQESNILDQLEAVFKTNIDPDYEGIEVESVEVLIPEGDKK